MLGARFPDAVERADAEPVGRFLLVSLPVLVPPVYGYREVDYGVTTGQELHFRSSAQVAHDLNLCISQHVIRTIRWPFWPGYGSTTAPPADGSWLNEPG